MSTPFAKHGSTDSREQTIANGKIYQINPVLIIFYALTALFLLARRKINAVAHALHLSEHHMEAAERIYKLALANNFTKGRHLQVVVATCLYVVCRQEKTPHMLIDFSDIMQVNVFVLGATFLKMVRTLYLSLPIIDPSLFICRFAALLQFGNKTSQIAADAMRLAQRMQIDWLHMGRRPSGVCGACLMIAARMNGFRRTSFEIVRVVKIADVTLKKRLREFKDTASGKLSVREFQDVWLEHAEDPPSFIAAQKQASGKHEAARRRAAKEVDDPSSIDLPIAVASQDVDGADPSCSSVPCLSHAPSTSSPMGENHQLLTPPPTAEPAKARSKPIKDISNEELFAKQAQELAEDAAFAAEVEGYLRDETLISAAKELEDTAKPEEREQPVSYDEDPELWSDLDDDLEIEASVLGQEEVTMKTKIWTELNHDYLVEQEEKKRKQQLDEEMGIVTKTPKVRCCICISCVNIHLNQ